jgi:hypothetical protein
MSRPTPPPRRLLIPGLMLSIAMMLALALSGPVSADTPISHSGTYGDHALTDTAATPGAHCRYGLEDSSIAGIRVRPPAVFAFSNDPDRTTVGWRAVIQRQLNGTGSWVNTQMSKIQFGTARTNRAASFTAISLPVRANGEASYRVQVRMFWYSGGKSLTQVGRAVHRVDWYGYTVGPNKGFCPGFVF